MKHVSFPWPTVVAEHDRMRLARALRAADSVVSPRSYHSLQTVKKIITEETAFAVTVKTQKRTPKRVALQPPSTDFFIIARFT